MSRNPPWERDELILALDLYFSVGARISPNHPEVKALSKVLNKLDIHPFELRKNKFRSSNSIHLKLQNYLAIDPAYHGKGLPHGGNAEREVWNEFHNNRTLLGKIADTICSTTAIQSPELYLTNESDESAFPEGRIVYQLHRKHERNRGLVRKKKERFLINQGSLYCEVCGFNFENVYGLKGKGFIECHHNVPVSDLVPGNKTRLRDLTLVCSNCHRILHRYRPWISVEELSKLVED